MTSPHVLPEVNLGSAATIGLQWIERRKHQLRSTRIVEWLETRKYLVLILLTPMYLAGTMGRAGGRPFWYDEVITLIAAKSPDLATTWRAALGTDANPPLPHLLTHLSISWFGLNEVSARLPAI